MCDLHEQYHKRANMRNPKRRMKSVVLMIGYTAERNQNRFQIRSQSANLLKLIPQPFMWIILSSKFSLSLSLCLYSALSYFYVSMSLTSSSALEELIFEIVILMLCIHSDVWSGGQFCCWILDYNVCRCRVFFCVPYFSFFFLHFEAL